MALYLSKQSRLRFKVTLVLALAANKKGAKPLITRNSTPYSYNSANFDSRTSSTNSTPSEVQSVATNPLFVNPVPICESTSL